MKNRKLLLAILLPVALIFSSIIPALADMAFQDDPSINHSAIALNMSQGSVAPMVAVGREHLVGLKSDGTVVAVGQNNAGQCEVSGWTDIVQIAADNAYTLGLRPDGTVIAVGYTPNLSRWADIVQIAAGTHVVGLKSDGTVIAKGQNAYWRGVRDWTDITQVAAGWHHTVGLRSDGTVVAVGNNYDGQCNVGDWTDIGQVAASSKHTVGLRSDGTVVAVGNNEHGQCDVGGWTDIVQVTTYWWTYTVGLKNDGTVITTKSIYTAVDVSNWNDIIQISGGWGDIAGLKSDGTVVSTEPDFPLGEWNLGIITEHTLTVSSTVGGAVTTPGEESFNYTAGAMIHLVAEPDADYHFGSWTGDVGAIFNVDAAATIITMNDNHSITANFEKNPPILLITVGIIAVVVLAIFFFHEKRTARTPYRQ